MARRWVGLSRPAKKIRRKAKIHHTLGVAGVVGMLMFATGLNFAMYPDAIAAVVGVEAPVRGFVPTETAAGAVPAPRTLVAVNEDEVHLLAATAWGEARSEGEDGMRAVAHVMVNRVGDRFGDDLQTVIRAPKQFSAWNLGDPNRPLVQDPERYATGGENLATWETAQKVAREVLSGQSVDPTGGALFYHTRAISPSWSRYGEGRTVIGAHVFYHDVPDRGVGRVFASVRRAISGGGRSQGPRAGRVHGVIQHAPVEAAHEEIPAPTTSIVTPPPTPPLNASTAPAIDPVSAT